jgi:tetratricopeptide (TPR) repeat protein
MAQAADDPLAGAMKQFDRHRYEQAARALEEALPKLDGARRAQAQLVLGTTYLRNAELHAAIARSAAAVQLDYLDRLARTGVEGRSVYARLFLAESLLASGNAAEAGKHFEQFRVSAAEANFLALAGIGLGSVAWGRRDAEQARNAWSGAGSSTEVVLARAAAESGVGTGDAKAQRRIADEASRARELSIRARRYLIEIYLAGGAPDKALAVARAANLAAASHVETFRAAKGTAKSISFYDLALLHGLTRLYGELARQQLEQAVTDARVKPTAVFYLADLYALLGREAEASKSAQAFLAEPQAPAPYRERVRARQAQLTYRQGKRAEAESTWSTIAEQGSDPEVQAAVVDACAAVGAECGKAIARLALIAEAGDVKRLRRLNAALGNYYLRKKDYARAIGYMEAARDKSNKNKIEANDPEMLAGLAEAYYRTKKYSEGLEIFFEMSKEFPVVRQIQEAMQGVYSMEQRSAGDVKIF